MLTANRSIEVFRRLYEGENTIWGNNSGAGSSPYWTIEYRLFLERFIHLNKIRSIIDIGCGDWQFSRFLNFDFCSYHGYDIVPSVIERNQELYGAENINFGIMPEDFDLLPNADLLIMKDVLQHLPDSDIFHHANKLFTRYKTCLISNSYRKAGAVQNTDIEIGDFRCLDLKSAPYNLVGVYVLEFTSPLDEQIRTFLMTSPS